MAPPKGWTDFVETQLFYTYYNPTSKEDCLFVEFVLSLWDVPDPGAPWLCSWDIGRPLESLFDHYHIGTLMEKNIDMLMYAALTMYLNGKREKHIPKVLIIA